MAPMELSKGRGSIGISGADQSWVHSDSGFESGHLMISKVSSSKFEILQQIRELEYLHACPKLEQVEVGSQGNR